MQSSERKTGENYFLIKWQNLVMPYIEFVGNGIYSISFNGKSFTVDQRCMDRLYRSGWISFNPSTGTFDSNFEYPALKGIVADIVRCNYFANRFPSAGAPAFFSDGIVLRPTLKS